MASFRHEISIARELATVFDAVADVRTHPRWQSGLLATEGDALETRAVGARGVEVRQLAGRPIRFPYEITAYDRPHRWGFRALGGPVRPEATLTFCSEGGGTRIRSDLIVPGVLGPLIGRVLARQQRRNYRRLKQLLEEGA